MLWSEIFWQSCECSARGKDVQSGLHANPEDEPRDYRADHVAAYGGRQCAGHVWHAGVPILEVEGHRDYEEEPEHHCEVDDGPLVCDRAH